MSYRPIAELKGAVQEARRSKWRNHKRAWRAQKRLESAERLQRTQGVDSPTDALINWAQDKLIVPDGPLAGRPFQVAPFQERFLRGALSPQVREAGLSIARKNGKSALCAILILGYLDGPLNTPNWRAGVTSLTVTLSVELRRQLEQIAIASELTDELGGSLTFRKAYPPSITGRNGSQIDFLSADRSTGHARGGDLALIDEAGLLQERNRSLWNAMFTSISGRDGRLIAISIQGRGPMFAELRQRKQERQVYWQEHIAPSDCDLDDTDAWDAANPGLPYGIKSTGYMKDACARALATPADQADFRAYDLNQPVDPAQAYALSLAQWKACLTEDLPAPSGPCHVGIDLGGSLSFTACAAYWPETGRLEVWAGIGSDPDLLARGKADAVGGRYVEMQRRGELTLYPGKVTPVRLFLEDALDYLRGTDIASLSADRFRQSEAVQVFDAAGLRPTVRVEWRGQGWKDGSEDLRRFQRACATDRVRTSESLLMASSIEGSQVMTDPAGNQKLDKRDAKSRIDALQAAILAVSAGLRLPVKRTSSYGGIV